MPTHVYRFDPSGVNLVHVSSYIKLHAQSTPVGSNACFGWLFVSRLGSRF